MSCLVCPVLTTSTPRLRATAMTVFSVPRSTPTTDMFVCDRCGGVFFGVYGREGLRRLGAGVCGRDAVSWRREVSTSQNLSVALESSGVCWAEGDRSFSSILNSMRQQTVSLVGSPSHTPHIQHRRQQPVSELAAAASGPCRGCVMATRPCPLAAAPPPLHRRHQALRPRTELSGPRR